MNSPTDDPSLVAENISPETDSPLKANWLALLFMASLLIISGATASVVGYKVKRADLDRKAQLLSAYERNGGSFEGLMTRTTTRVSENDSSTKSIFLATYEVNERARKIGLYSTLETLPPYVVTQAISGLELIDSKDSYFALKDTWQALQEAETAAATAGTQGAVNPKAIRLAKRYDRHHARDVEAKLFKFLVDHRAEIAP
jgi:hypothetical protein